MQANPTSVDKGDAATLSWTSTDATQLTIAPDVGAVPTARLHQTSLQPLPPPIPLPPAVPAARLLPASRITVATASASSQRNQLALPLTIFARLVSTRRLLRLQQGRYSRRCSRRLSAETAEYPPQLSRSPGAYCRRPLRRRGSTGYTRPRRPPRQRRQELPRLLGHLRRPHDTASFGKERLFCTQSTRIATSRIAAVTSFGSPSNWPPVSEPRG